MIISSRLTDEELVNEIHLSVAEYANLIGKSYLIIGKNKKSTYNWFECDFEKKNFMHLLGIKSRTLSADEFFDKCMDYNKGVGNGITIKDCTPSRNHSRKTINEKCSCSKDLFRICNAKYMKIGLKDKISQFVDFTYAYGSDAIIGFQREKSIASFPITLIPNKIDNFSVEKYRIVFVLDKAKNDILYENILMEIKKNLFRECFSELPDALKSRISLV